MHRGLLLLVSLVVIPLVGLTHAATAGASKRSLGLRASIRIVGGPVAGSPALFKIRVKVPAKRRIARYDVSFGDRTKALRGVKPARQVRHIYARPGQYVARLTVIDSSKRRIKARVSVTVRSRGVGVGAPPVTGSTPPSVSPGVGPSPPSQPSPPSPPPFAAPPGDLDDFTTATPDRINAATPLPGGGARLNDELLITVGTPDSPGDRATAERAAAATGGAVSGGLVDLGVYEIRWVTPQDISARRTELLAQPAVTDVSFSTVGLLDTNQQPPGDWADDGPQATWPFSQVRAQAAWETTQGSDVTVGVVDGGVALQTHEDLNIKKKLGRDEAIDHATHVAGLACAKANGIGLVGMSWGCPIVTQGWGDRTDKSILRAANEVAKEPGVKVVNMSVVHINWSLPKTSCYTASQQDAVLGPARDPTSLKQKFRDLFTGKKGREIVWTISAGNNCAAGVASPWGQNADLANVITVAATNSDRTLARFSGFGPGVEVAAPGGVSVGTVEDGTGGNGTVGLWSTWANGSYMPESGTSMSAPVVAGIAALVRSANPGYSADQAARCITTTAGSGGIAVTRSALPAGADPQVDYSPRTLPIVNAEAAVDCRTFNPPSNPTRILIAGTGWEQGEIPALTDLLRSAGYTVTTSSTLPADLSSYGQVWWVGLQPPPASGVDQLSAFARAGGSLYLTGERPCCEALNSADTTIINRLVVSVGGITFGGLGDFSPRTQPVNPGAPGGLASTPFAIDTWAVGAPGGMTNVARRHVFASTGTGGNGTPLAAAWDARDVVGGGRVVVFMDINWLSSSYRGANWGRVAQNVALFLSGRAAPPGPTVATSAGEQSLDRSLEPKGDGRAPQPAPASAGPNPAPSLP